METELTSGGSRPYSLAARSRAARHLEGPTAWWWRSGLVSPSPTRLYMNGDRLTVAWRHVPLHLQWTGTATLPRHHPPVRRLTRRISAPQGHAICEEGQRRLA